MNPSNPGAGYRFLVKSDKPRKGDERWDSDAKEWKPTNVFWFRQFGNPSSMRRRLTFLDWYFDDITVTWTGVLYTSEGEPNDDGDYEIKEQEVLIRVDEHGWFISQWQIAEVNDEVTHPTLWHAIAFCEQAVDQAIKNKAAKK